MDSKTLDQQWKELIFVYPDNIDLWKRYLLLHHKFKIHYNWVKGHNGHPENERCDVLAVQGAESKNQLVDTYFEEVQSKED